MHLQKACQRSVETAGRSERTVRAVLASDPPAFSSADLIVDSPPARSFGLWAGMANTGVVWSAPLWAPPPLNGLVFSAPGTNWKWSTAPVMYPDVGKAAGIRDKGDIEEIVEWLRTH